MRLLKFLESKLSIRKIILLPAFIGPIPFVIYIIFFPNNHLFEDFSFYFWAFLGGFIGLLMIHYKQIPQQDVDPRFAVFLGIFTTAGCWLGLLIMIFTNTVK